MKAERMNFLQGFVSSHTEIKERIKKHLLPSSLSSQSLAPNHNFEVENAEWLFPVFQKSTQSSESLNQTCGDGLQSSLAFFSEHDKNRRDHTHRHKLLSFLMCLP